MRWMEWYKSEVWTAVEMVKIIQSGEREGSADSAYEYAHA